MEDNATPDVVGPVYGWRTFVMDDDDLLRSPVYPVPWPGHGCWLTAECLSTMVRPGQYDFDHDQETGISPAPDPRCECGIYLCDTVMDMLKTVMAIGAYDAVAKVEAKGRYLRYRYGWRVEQARVVGLVVPRVRKRAQHTRALAGMYGVETLDGDQVLANVRAAVPAVSFRDYCRDRDISPRELSHGAYRQYLAPRSRASRFENWLEDTTVRGTW